MTGDRSLGIALQLTDIVGTRVVGDRRYPSSVASAGDVVALARRLEPHFGHLWLTDNLGYRNTPVLLAAVAASTSTLGLGTFTAYPYGRDPVDTATMLATLKELLGPRDLAFGLSRGSRAVIDQRRGERPLAVLGEYIRSLRALLTGETVPVDAVPELARAHRLGPGAVLSTHLEPVDVPLLVASTGPQTLRLAGAVADGVQFVTQQPTQSAGLLADPSFPDESGLAVLDDARARSGRGGAFRRVYGISVSVARDPADAVGFARRQVAGVLATKRDEQLVAVGIDPQIAGRVRQALDGGRGLDEAGRHVPLDVVRTLIATGTAAEVADQVAGSIEHSRKWGFAEHFVCFPLGPDIKDAVDTIVGEVLPALE